VVLLELQYLLFLIVAVFLIEAWRLRSSGPRLVLREFRIQPDAPSGEFVYIQGRRAGVLAWFLTLIGLPAQTSFSVTRDEVARETMGPSGFQSAYAPMTDVCSSMCYFYRAFSILVLSFLCYAAGLLNFLTAALRSNDYARQVALREASTSLWISLSAGTLLYVWYVLSKRVIIAVRSTGGDVLGISFKRSIIENVGVDLKRAMEAVDLVNARLASKNPI
jgi:hypothetical protein